MRATGMMGAFPRVPDPDSKVEASVGGGGGGARARAASVLAAQGRFYQALTGGDLKAMQDMWEGAVGELWGGMARIAELPLTSLRRSRLRWGGCRTPTPKSQPSTDP